MFIAERVFKGHEETWFEDQSIRQALVDLVETLKKQTDNTIAFRSQLARLLSTNAHDELLARLEKGSSYYSDLLAEHMGKVIRNNAILGRLSGTKAYREDLSELDAALMKKLSEIGKCVHVAQCILGGAEVTRNAAVEKALKDRRQVMLDLTGAYIATLPGVAPGKSGRVRKGKRSEPGYVRAPKRTKAEIGKTYDKTYELHKQGLTLEEVAKQRSLSKTTIEGHFAKGIAEGHVDIDKVMPVEFKEAIASWMREHIDQGLNAAQAHFDGRFDYGELRMVQAWIKKGDV